MNRGSRGEHGEKWEEEFHGTKVKQTADDSFNPRRSVNVGRFRDEDLWRVHFAI
jgi:hypothetical protein